MDFLKDALGEDFDSFKEKIEKYNEQNENQLKLANLSEGGYVSREKYDALAVQVEKAKNENAQAYKDELDKLKEQMAETEKNHAIDMAIKNAGAKNLTAVKALLNLENSDVQSIEKQLEIVRSENDYLFEKPLTTGTTGMRQGSAKRETSAEEELRKTLFGKY